MKLACVALVLVGIIWLVTQILAFVVITGIATPTPLGTNIIYSLSSGAGPLLLIVGPVLVLTKLAPRLGASMAVVGCILLTWFGAWTVFDAYNIQPLQRKPDYIDHLINTAIASLVLVSDYLAFALSRMIFVAAR